MEVQILYTIDYIIPSKNYFKMVKIYCEEHNIAVEKTDKIGIYRFTGSYEENIRKVQINFKLKVYDNPPTQKPINTWQN